MRNRTVWGAAALAVVTVVGAASAAGAGGLPQHGYVADTIQLPTTNTQAASLGRNIDGHPGPDNLFGQVLATLSAQGFDLGGVMSQAVTTGDVVMLHSLRTDSLANTRTATWQVRYSDPVVDPNLTGSGTFSPSRAIPRSGRLAAKIKNHHVRTVAGEVPLRLDLGPDSPAFTLWMDRAVVFATCRSTACTAGRINGAVSRDQIDTVFVPALVAMMQPIVARDCPLTCTDGSIGKTFEDLFDTDHDLVITVDEVLTTPLIGALLAPDVDLQAADGSPGHDGVADSLSFGIGFTDVRATIS